MDDHLPLHTVKCPMSYLDDLAFKGFRQAREEWAIRHAILRVNEAEPGT
jgi:hypothetical protein